ncbi:alpha/beta fold hydrolase [Histidinibacterium lentulum]|uniref:Alpha/beta hydrolase n=1 Tax=Histidinibacterium lentulum TaxID=2480588 RepID=A0A3N2QYI8_9RHOB|nr:alpha/beta hydrolase [Histidinibacterium lentulum]ROU00272.1 alpha/beta hydrolase [Histidinibacterium lentulum]
MPTFHHDPGDALIHYGRTGPDGPPVLCLPGLGTRSAYLAGLAGRLGRGLVLLDFPGTGQSEPLRGLRHDPATLAEVVIALILEIGEGAVDVFGHSLGGTVACLVAERRPDLVGTLIVGEGNFAPGGGAASSAIAAQDVEAFVARGFAERQAKLRARALEGDRLAAAIHAACRGDDPRALHEMAAGLVDLAPGVREAFLAHPGKRVFVYGETTFPGGDPARVTPDAPDPAPLEAAGALIEVVPGAGHLMPVEAPEATAEVLARHL